MRQAQRSSRHIVARLRPRYDRLMKTDAIDAALSTVMRALARRRWAVRQTRYCRYCGARMEQATLARQYCTGSCRALASLARRRAPTLEQLRRG
jgi:hypothetical protein